MDLLKLFSQLKKLESKHCLYHYECDKNGDIRLVTLMNLLQNTAQKHISKLGYGVEEFAKQSLAWIATKYSIKVKKLPKANEKFIIRTWVSETNKLTAIREFLITDRKGNVLIEILSKWALIDVIRRKPVEIPKTPIWDKKLSTSGFTQLRMKRVDYVKEFPINFDNIDFNQHVNNSFYILWATETVEPDFRLKHYPKEIVVSFHKEAVYGDNVAVSTQIDGFNTIHKIVSKNTGMELTRVSIKWN